MVIIKCDLILHEYYITIRHKSMITRYEKTGRCSRVAKKNLKSWSKGGRLRMIYCWSASSTRKSWSSTEGFTSFHALRSRHAGLGLSEGNPTSTKNEAKWRAQENQHVPSNVLYLKSYKHISITTKQYIIESIQNQVEYNQFIICLLLLIQSICLDMCPSVLVHIYPYMSKMRFGYWKLMVNQRTMFRMGPVYTRDSGLRIVRYWARYCL